MSSRFKSETWEDDYVVPFSDSYIEREAASAIGQSGGPIPYGMVKRIKKLELGPCFCLDDIEYIPMADLKYFTGLEILSVSGAAGGIDALANCRSLISLHLEYAYDLTDLTPLASCPSLASLELSECIDLTDLAPLASCPSLT